MPLPRPPLPPSSVPPVPPLPSTSSSPTPTIEDTAQKNLLAELAARTLIRDDLQQFVYRFFAHLSLKPGWFHRTLSDALIQFLKDVENKLSPRLIIEAPPRHSKSLFTTRGFTPWLLANHPDWDLIVANSTQKLANYFGRDIQRVMNDPEYQAAFPKSIPRTDSNAVDFATTVSNGQYKLVGAEGKLPGFGGRCLIGDDLVGGREMAESETQMESLWNWFNGDFMNRVSPGGGVIVMNTRWGVNDLTGRILANDPRKKWKRISFPAIAEEDEPHRKAGEALQPDWYPLHVLEEERDRLIAVGKERDWLSLFQQRPTNQSGNFFKSSHFVWRNVEDLPSPSADDTSWYLGVDFAASTKSTADCAALIPIGVRNNGFYYFGPDAITGRYTALDFVEKILDKVEKYKPLKLVCEKGPLDAVFAPILRTRMRERGIYVSIEPISRRAEKYVVAGPLQARFEASMVIIPDNQFYRLTLVPQFLNFSETADNQEDGLVDAASNVFSLLDKLQPPAPILPPRPKSAADEDKEHWDKIMKFGGAPQSKVPFTRLNGTPIR